MVTNRLTLHSDFEKTSFEMIPLLLFNETFIKAHVCWLKVIIYYWTLYQSFGLDNHSYFSSVHEFFTFCIPSIDMLKSPQRSMKNFPRLPSPRLLGVASVGWTEVVGRCAWVSGHCSPTCVSSLSVCLPPPCLHLMLRHLFTEHSPQC